MIFNMNFSVLSNFLQYLLLCKCFSLNLNFNIPLSFFVIMSPYCDFIVILYFYKTFLIKYFILSLRLEANHSPTVISPYKRIKVLDRFILFYIESFYSKKLISQMCIRQPL